MTSRRAFSRRVGSSEAERQRGIFLNASPSEAERQRGILLNASLALGL